MPQYKFITLDFPFTDDTRAYGLNNAGQVVGSYGVLDPQGFLFSNNTFSTLNDPNLTFGPGNHATTATGINDQNEIVGFTGAGHAFYDIAGTFTDFTWPGATSTWAEGVNASGQIVGYARNISIGMAGGNIVGYLYDQGNFTTISDPLASTAQGLGTFAQDINDAGQIVGYYDATAGGRHGFIYNNGTYTTLDAGAQPTARLRPASTMSDRSSVTTGRSVWPAALVSLQRRRLHLAGRPARRQRHVCN